jgi:hypothetical protein
LNLSLFPTYKIGHLINVIGITDLKAYPTALFTNLYHQCWGIEEDYKVLKNHLNIDNYSSVSVEGILQELYAELLTKSLNILDSMNIKSISLL